MKRLFTSNSRTKQKVLSPTSVRLGQNNTERKTLVSEVSKRRDRCFEELLLAAVDEAFSSLGHSGKKTVYSQLEKVFKINRNDIYAKIEEFTVAIEEIFGEGAKLLEIQIMRLLHEEIRCALEYFPKKNELVFTEYIISAGAIKPSVWRSRNICLHPIDSQ